MKLVGSFRQRVIATWVPQAIAAPVFGVMKENPTTVLMAMGPPEVTRLAEPSHSNAVSLAGKLSSVVATNLDSSGGVTSTAQPSRR